MQSEEKKENITISTNNQSPDQTAPFNKEELTLKRKKFRENSNNLINSTLNYYSKIKQDDITIEKIDCLNSMLYNTLTYLENNILLLINSNNIDISKIDAEQISNDEITAIQELNLWNNIYNFIEKYDNYINITDYVYFLHNTKNYINNVIYKNN